MGLEKNTGRATFVNIKEGRLYTREKAGADPEFFDSISGYLVKVDFKNDEYNGKKFEICGLTIVDNGEKFLLQMRTDSGYFRGFCNSLRTGNPSDKMVIIPKSEKGDNDKPKTTCFVNQNGKSLKHAFTLKEPGDLPPVEKIIFKGNEEWDGTKQLNYWKNWLSNVPLAIEFLAEDDLPPAAVAESVSPGADAASFNRPTKEVNAAEITEPFDDLPF